MDVRFRSLMKIAIMIISVCRPRYSKDIIITETRNDASDPPPYFYEPEYYNGPTMFNDSNTWGAEDGQKYRYCNFHYNRYNILNTVWELIISKID